MIALNDPSTGRTFLERAYHLQDADDCKALYDEWAESYDSHVTDPSQGYVAPALVAAAVVRAGGNIAEGTVFDAGCGTGLSGIALRQAGAQTIDGVDLSPGMIDVARKTGAYRNLGTADLSQPLHQQHDDSYDVVTCVGTLTQTHVGPRPALEEFVRITKNGGSIVATVLDDIWESGGYRAEVDRLTSSHAVSVVSADSADYRKGADVSARILVLRKT